MTEQEAIIFIKNSMQQSKYILSELKKVKEPAKRAKRVGEYYSHLEHCEKELEACEVAISALEEVQQYRDIGTVEECREARERQRAKKPNIYGDGYDDEGKIIYDMYDCPNCNKSYELDYEEYDFCPNCGQAIDWSEDK